MKKHLELILAAVMAVVILAGCVTAKPETGLSKEWETVYTDYLQAMGEDVAEAIDSYCHYEYEFQKELAMAQTGDLVTDYEVLNWVQLNDDLWVVTARIQSKCYPDSRDVNNFVGLIDGRYYVMTGVDQVPVELSEGVNLEVYRPTGENVLGSGL